MRRIIQTTFLGSATLMLMFALSTTAFAQNGVYNGVGANALFGNQYPMMQLGSSMLIQGDYVAAGVGMRNVGSGTINLATPAGSTVKKAWLTWAIIWQATEPANTVDINGNTVNGTLLGRSGSPCWGGDSINFYYADVTAYAVSGNNSITNMPSGLTNGTYPGGSFVYPLAEGATLVMAYCHPDWDWNSITVFGGSQTFALQDITEDLGDYYAFTGGNAADQVAQTTFVMADGQSSSSFAAGGYTQFNGVQTSGPGTAIRTSDAFPGADGFVSVHPDLGLWDTHTIDVSSFFPNATVTGADATAGTQNDCLTWGMQVISVKTHPAYYLDIKANSCPNPLNINSGGVLPVSILGTAYNNVADIDVSTVRLNGVAPTGNPSYSDQATPYYDVCGDSRGCMDCTTDSADGYMDLNLKFKKKDIIAAIGNVQDGECVQLNLRGLLNSGIGFFASDNVWIIDRGKGHPKQGASAVRYDLEMTQNSPNPFSASTTFRYTLPDAMNVQLEVFNTLGKRVAVIYNGTSSEGDHVVTWNGVGSNGTALNPGTYIYRLTAGDNVLSKMLVITR